MLCKIRGSYTSELRSPTQYRLCERTQSNLIKPVHLSIYINSSRNHLGDPGSSCTRITCFYLKYNLHKILKYILLYIKYTYPLLITLLPHPRPRLTITLPLLLTAWISFACFVWLFLLNIMFMRFTYVFAVFS